MLSPRLSSVILLFSVISLVLCPVVAEAKDETVRGDDSDWQVIFQLDNDLFAGEDRNYTNGVRLAFVKELNQKTDFNKFLQRQLYSLSGAKDDTGFLSWRLRDRENLRFAYGTGLTQLMFTPSDFSALRAPEGQRPYAGWLGLELSLHAKNDEQVSGVTLSIGTTGESSFAEEAQEWVHKNISNSPIFQGWDSQVPNELTLNLHFDHKQHVGYLDRKELGSIDFDGYFEWGAAIGNFRTNLYGGGLVRAGYNLPASYSTPRVQLGSYGHELFRAADPERKPFSALLFAGVRATAVAYDITLDGPLFNDFDTRVESKPLFGEFIAGFGVRYRSVDLSYSHTVRSDEFYSQSENQQFGSVMLRFHSGF